MSAAQWAAGPFFLSAGVVLWAGAAKLRRPASAERALAAARLPSSPLAVRILGAAEVALGAWCLTQPTALAVLGLGALYAGFAVFLSWVLIRRVPLGSCGCLGAAEAPPGFLHVALNVLAALACASVSFARLPGLVPFALGLPFRGTSFLLGLVALALLLGPTVRQLPRLFFSYGAEAS